MLSAACAWRRLGMKTAMNYATDFKSIKDQVSAQEWQTRLALAACRLVDKYDMTDLVN